MMDLEAKEKVDFLFKYIIIGDTGVGKSCMLNRYLRNQFNPNTKHTVGVEFGMKYEKVNTKTIRLQIWDTAGQERFKSVTRSYFRGSIGVVIVYDITRPESFERVKTWLAEVKQFARSQATYMIFGNKRDMEHERQVKATDAALFAQENECLFLEGSAQKGENVEEAFSKLTKTVIYKIDSGEIPEDIVSAQQRKESSNLKSSEEEAGVEKPGRCSGYYC